MRRNKRGNVTDIAFLVVSLVFVAVFCFVGYFVFSQMTSRLVANPQINASPDAVRALNSIDTANNKLDYFVLMIFIGMSIAIVITSWFLGGHPLFMVLYFLVLIILVVVGMVLSNTWENVTQKTNSLGYRIWGTTLDHFPITNNLLTYLPIYIVVVGFLGMVAMFGKPFMEGGGGDGY